MSTDTHRVYAYRQLIAPDDPNTKALEERVFREVLTSAAMDGFTYLQIQMREWQDIPENGMYLREFQVEVLASTEPLNGETPEEPQPACRSRYLGPDRLSVVCEKAKGHQGSHCHGGEWYWYDSPR